MAEVDPVLVAESKDAQPVEKVSAEKVKEAEIWVRKLRQEKASKEEVKIEKFAKACWTRVQFYTCNNTLCMLGTYITFTAKVSSVSVFCTF